MARADGSTSVRSRCTAKRFRADQTPRAVSSLTVPRKHCQLPTPKKPTPRRSALGVGGWVLGVALLFVLALPAAAQLAPTGTLRATFIGNNPAQGRVGANGATTGPCPDLVREF